MLAFIAMALLLVAAARGDNVATLFDDANTAVLDNSTGGNSGPAPVSGATAP
jgi:hypothetical protein